MPIPLVIAGLLSTLAANGLDLIGKAVIAKGKDVIEEELGVNIESSLQTEEGKLKLKELELKHEEFLLKAAKDQAEINLAHQALELDNTKNARDSNVRIQETVNASYLSKNAPYWMDLFIVICTFSMGFMILFQEVPPANREIFYTMFGSLLTVCLTVVQFHRGSSSRSAAKDDTISNLSKQVTI